jgi:hypothetical protein
VQHKNARVVRAFLRAPNTQNPDQCWGFSGLLDLAGAMNDPAGTTTCFGFFGFFASLFPRNWPFAMTISLQQRQKYCWARLLTQNSSTR